MSTWKTAVEHILGKSVTSSLAVAGSGFAQTLRVTAADKKIYFCKFAQAPATIFREEAAGLEALRATQTVRVPTVFHADANVLLCEWIEGEEPQAAMWPRLGKQLSALHAQNVENYGFTMDNHIGATPQNNPRLSVSEISWSEYFIEHRLKPMLHHSSLAHDALLQATFTKCEASIRLQLDRVKEKPCLVHGDFWNGNFLCASDQMPYLIDPAPYWGHREVDLAMSELFAGFDETFYSAYQTELPLAPGYEQRKVIYNLYHLMNHWILFGESYKNQTMQAFRKL